MKERQQAVGEDRPKRVRSQPPAPNERAKGWVDIFNEQLKDPDLRRRALAYARGCVSSLQKCGVQVSSAFADDLLDDSISKTWSGKLTWKPGPELTLLKHLKDAIRDRARREWKKAQKFPAASLDAYEDDEDDDRATGLWIEVETALAANASVGDACKRIIATETFDRSRLIAHGDREAVRMLDAIRAGATDRGELMRVLDLTGRQYESIRRRLDRLLLELPASMVDRAPDVRLCKSTHPGAMRHTALPCSTDRQGACDEDAASRHSARSPCDGVRVRRRSLDSRRGAAQPEQTEPGMNSDAIPNARPSA